MRPADGEGGLAHGERRGHRTGQDHGPGRLEQPVVDHGRSLRVGLSRQYTRARGRLLLTSNTSFGRAFAPRRESSAGERPGAGGQRLGAGEESLTAARIGERFASSLASARNEPGASLDSA